MSYFNIDFNQFKPSSRPGGSPIAPENSIWKPAQTTIPTPKISSPTIPSVSPQPEGNKFMSGSVLNKVFDVLRIPEYAIASFQKGEYDTRKQLYQERGIPYETPGQSIKSGKVGLPSVQNALRILQGGVANIIPGIKNRTSFFGDEGYNAANEAGVTNPIASTALNTTLSFSSPTLPVGKISNLLGKGGNLIKSLPGVSKVTGFLEKSGGIINKAAKETPLVYKAIEKVNPFFRAPEFGKLLETAQQRISPRLNNLYKLLEKSVQKLSPAEQARVGQILEGSITSDKKLAAIAEPIRKLTEQIGKEAVDLKILDPKSFEKYKGVYLKHIFERHLDQASQFFGGVKRELPGISKQFTATRKGVEGYLRQFAPGVWTGLGSGIKDIEIAKFYKQVADKYGVAVKIIKEGGKIVRKEVPAGFVLASDVIKVPKVSKFFTNKAVPQAVADYLERTTQMKVPSTLDKLTNAWKLGVTILNPAYHGRNLMSNQILSEMSTKEGIPKTIVNYVKAVRTYFGKGDQAFFNAAEDIGLINNRNLGAGLDEFLEFAGLIEKKGLQSIPGKVTDFMKKFQRVSEETSKLNVFKFWVQKTAQQTGKTVQVALKDPEILALAKKKAEQAIFSPYLLSQAEKSLVKSVIPFYSFTRQAVPFFFKTIMENPGTIAKYGRIKDAIESLSYDPMRSKQRTSQYEDQIRLPFKNKEGQETYLDPTYIYPFGNFLEPGGNQGKLPFGFGINPIVQTPLETTMNYSAWNQKPITESNIPEKATLDKAGYAANSLAPAFPKNIINKLLPLLQGKPGNQNAVQALLNILLGIKTSNVSDETMQQSVEKGNVAKLRSIQNEEELLKQLSPAEQEYWLPKLKGIYQNLRSKAQQ